MAILIIDGEQQEVPDGSAIMDACDDAGVPFGCRAGQCGMCIITISEGLENLEPMNACEQDMGLADDQRLGCQTIIRSGTIVASY